MCFMTLVYFTVFFPPLLLSSQRSKDLVVATTNHSTGRRCVSLRKRGLLSSALRQLVQSAFWLTRAWWVLKKNVEMSHEIVFPDIHTLILYIYTLRT